MSENKPAPAKKPAMSIEKAQKARRKFLHSAGLTGAVIGLSLLGYIPVTSAKTPRLRPPGALNESDFLSSCIKCGQCVQVCPVQAIKLGDLKDGFGVGVPHIDAREQACDFSCDAVQCILACPTGSLTYKKPGFLNIREGALLAAAPILKAKEKDAEPTLNLKERIGVARLARPESCLAVQGKGFKGEARSGSFKGKMRYMDVDRWKPIPVREHPYDVPLCDLCVRECPVKDAIALKPVKGADGVERMTPVVLEPCVGCGVCEMICPAEPAAIVIDAQATWKEA
ncbi:4Fe-4S dicluster domain-containing protein [Dechloromonas denitrificans]|uniref:4Fe-4S dicluster domain-containing protein n=1 Tax=Dechloromonas denitrificans TaxID=281362 RepID=UPI001CF85EFC|nr:4Fe-4S dicluster domain-containing protein [Dechloromonas denitrificans]UCV10488.1 4Fe-4S dicluster domain-containing protein [Dechloromonas denitrificans]